MNDKLVDSCNRQHQANSNPNESKSWVKKAVWEMLRVGAVYTIVEKSVYYMKQAPLPSAIGLLASFGIFWFSWRDMKKFKHQFLYFSRVSKAINITAPILVGLSTHFIETVIYKEPNLHHVILSLFLSSIAAVSALKRFDPVIDAYFAQGSYIASRWKVEANSFKNLSQAALKELAKEDPTLEDFENVGLQKFRIGNSHGN